MRPKPLSLYLHIPFCTLKCSYCDFNSYAGLEGLVDAYIDALTDEIRLWGEAVRGRPLATIFFGGGTPSLLTLPQLERIFSAIHTHFQVEAGAEVSLEANPGTVEAGYLRELLALGVNRLSLGVQSFHDDELVALDRIHSAEEARQAYRWARKAGFERISLDLIYGLPEQPLERWQATLAEAVALEPDHLSLYALTVEEGTKLAYDIDHGRVPAPDGDAQAEMYEWSGERLAAAGYAQYEISNWATPGQECQHNLTYWRNGEWLGLGAGGHSHFGGFRFADVYSPKQYVRHVEETAAAGLPPAEDTRSLLKAMRQVTYLEEQTPDVAMADTAILALRLNEGLSPEEFRSRFGRELSEVYGDTIAELASAGLLDRHDGRLRLTARGRLLANEVFVRLLPD